jgi:hypothetical protein
MLITGPGMDLMKEKIKKDTVPNDKCYAKKTSLRDEKHVD